MSVSYTHLQAGQFIIFRSDENGERVPLTIADVNKEKGELTPVSYTHLKLRLIVTALNS